METSTISMVIFHSYVSLPEGQAPLNPIKPSFSYGFPMVFTIFHYKHPMKSHEITIFPWFSYGFPMVFIISYGFPMVFLMDISPTYVTPPSRAHNSCPA